MAMLMMVMTNYDDLSLPSQMTMKRMRRRTRKKTTRFEKDRTMTRIIWKGKQGRRNRGRGATKPSSGGSTGTVEREKEPLESQKSSGSNEGVVGGCTGTIEREK